MALTIGQVSAIIAAAVFVLQILVPNIVSLILVGVLRHTHSATTWSVVQRDLFSSHWPLLTKSDSVAIRSVDRKIKSITLTSPIVVAIISVAAVVTPLGLHDSILPSTTTNTVPFGYLADSSPFGSAYMPRNGQPFTRVCAELYVKLPCPGSRTQLDFTYDDLDLITNSSLRPGTTYDTNVPQSLVDLYESGLDDHPSSVASFFDIENRVCSYANRSDFNNGERWLVSTFRMLQSLVLDQTPQLIEGLIVDMPNGGIGFRNHTIPQQVGLAAEWTEDILFIEPETECVNTNLTYEFTIGAGGFDSFGWTNFSLVDRGGFVGLNRTYPELDLSNPQKEPNLKDRAYKAAWLTNVWTMLVMNVTRPNPNRFAYMKSNLGKRFPMDTWMATNAHADAIAISESFESLVNPDWTGNASFSNSTKSLYSNPFNLTSANYSTVKILCEGAGPLDLANSTNIRVACGLLFGAAQPTGDNAVRAPIIPLPYTTWQQPIYACASALKASIKQVTFRYNATMGHDLSALKVTNITVHSYSNEESMPLWGVESLDYNLVQVNQLWGIISPEKANAPNLTTFRAPYMHLPGFRTPDNNQLFTTQYLPAHDSPNSALTATYDQALAMYDWTGSSSIAMLNRWRNMSSTTEDSASIINLIWADLAANKMTSSRNWNKPATRTNSRKRAEMSPVTSIKRSDGEVVIPVTTYERKVQYNWAYGVPAILTLTISVILLVSAVLLSIFKHSGIHHMRFYIDSLSSGRLLAAAQHPGVADKLAPTRTWITQVGNFPITLYNNKILRPFSSSTSSTSYHPAANMQTAYQGYAGGQEQGHAEYHGNNHFHPSPAPLNPDYQTTQYIYGGPPDSTAPFIEKPTTGGVPVRYDEIVLAPLRTEPRQGHNGYVRISGS